MIRSPIAYAVALLAATVGPSRGEMAEMIRQVDTRDFFVPLSLRGRYERRASVTDLAYIAARRRRERQTHRHKRWRGGAL